jgi:hypothetical protein
LDVETPSRPGQSLGGTQLPVIELCAEARQASPLLLQPEVILHAASIFLMLGKKLIKEARREGRLLLPLNSQTQEEEEPPPCAASLRGVPGA